MAGHPEAVGDDDGLARGRVRQIPAVEPEAIGGAEGDHLDSVVDRPGGGTMQRLRAGDAVRGQRGPSHRHHGRADHQAREPVEEPLRPSCRRIPAGGGVGQDALSARIDVPRVRHHRLILTFEGRSADGEPAAHWYRGSNPHVIHTCSGLPSPLSPRSRPAQRVPASTAVAADDGPCVARPATRAAGVTRPPSPVGR